MMSRAGLKVLVLERHYIVGGCTHTWEENGYEWDTGVHYVGESISHESPKSTGKVLKFLTDGKLKWEIMDDVYDIVKSRLKILIAFNMHNNKVWKQIIKWIGDIYGIDELDFTTRLFQALIIVTISWTILFIIAFLIDLKLFCYVISFLDHLKIY